jgi:hypothetical protein
MTTSTFAPLALDAGSAGAPQRTTALRSRLQRAGLAIWRTLEASGRARAMRELRQLHDGWGVSDENMAEHVRAAHAYLVGEGTKRGE